MSSHPGAYMFLHMHDTMGLDDKLMSDAMRHFDSYNKGALVWGDSCTYDSTMGTFTYPNKMKLNRTANPGQQSAVLRDWGINIEAQLQEDAEAVDETGKGPAKETTGTKEASPNDPSPVDGSDGDEDREEKCPLRGVGEDSAGSKNAEDKDGVKCTKQAEKEATLSPSEVSTSTLNDMVRDKEKVDAADKSPSNDVNERVRSWVATKSAQHETRIRKALGIDCHPDDNKHRDKHGNSRRSGEESSKGTSKAGFSDFGKNEQWAADQVKVANAR